MNDADDELLLGADSLRDPAAGDSPSREERRSPWARLLAQDVDTIIDELCAGRPRDLVSECREHVADNAYFVEEGRVAARAIATVAGLADLAARDMNAALDQLETLIEESTADVLAEGPLGPDDIDLEDRPSDEHPPLAVRLSRRLGVSITAGLRLIPTLNDMGFSDRHVVYHCLLGGLSPRDYAEAFEDDPAVIEQMLAEVTRWAVEGGLE